MALEIINAPISLKGKIIELCRETYEAHRHAAPSDWAGNFFDPFIKPMIEAAFRSKKGRTLKESPSLFVAQLDGAFAGYFRLSHCPTNPKKDYYSVEIQDIYVLPEHRRKGVARAMIAHAKALSQTHDWDTLDATVADWNVGSRQLFAEEGFAVTSRKLSFGPERAARDIPLPAGVTIAHVLRWLWPAVCTGLAALLLISR